MNVSKSNEKSESNDNLDNSFGLEHSGFFIQECKIIEEVEDIINLKIDTVKVLPRGFNISNISVISNEIIQIEYSNGEDNITFRAGKDIDNISGDYNIYKIKNDVKVNGIDVDLEGNNEKVFNLAGWKKESISYSISATNGIDEDEMLNMIKSIV
ncbi:DUF4367 domain-containing protein [Clostridium neonatale]|uniref:DUF4367 domain-containing protein n=1 Tax=Clostridium neonatale TaxID=137838 RepID=UPI00293714BA|nr:DUF4367 domain-containing protein [Clostridium neonatale]